jgi:hypothetical protein
MKFNRLSALGLLAFASVACHKNSAPSPSGSAAALGSAGALPPTSAASGASLAVLDNFEGEISVAAKGKLGGKQALASPISFRLQVKDGKFRVDLPEGLAPSEGLGKAYALVTPADKKLYFVLDAKKQTILVDFDKFAAQAKALSRARPQVNSAGAPNVEKTGKTDTVAGYKCEIWRIAQATSTGELCIAAQGASWFNIPLTGVPAEYAWASEITDGKHFPLRFVALENGVEQGRLEVTAIEKKAMPAEAFAVPPFPVIDLEQMLGGMLGGMGMMPGMMPPGMMAPGASPGSTPGVHPPQHGLKKKP